MGVRLLIKMNLHVKSIKKKKRRPTMGQAHARDPLLPKCWPLYQCHCVCLRLSVSPAWISGRAHLWPSQPLSLKCKRVRFGTVVCRYPEVSLKGQTWALSPPAFSRSGRFYTFSIPPPLLSFLYSLQTPSMLYPRTPLGNGACRGSRKASRGWEIVASLGTLQRDSDISGL